MKGYDKMNKNNCSICGPNIDTENIEFSKNESNLVYLDKVYSYNEDKAASILQKIDTSSQEQLQTELIIGNAITGCSPCQNMFCCQDNSCVLDSNAVFSVEEAGFLVESFELSTPSNLTSSDVSLEGQNVGSLTYQGGQYTAGINSILPEVMKCDCLDSAMPSKNYFVVENAGPWILSGVIFATGTVTTGGKTCRFRLRIKTSPSEGFYIPETVNFVVPRLSVPCSINGVAPVIRFSFGGTINLLKPSISVVNQSATTANGNGGTSSGTTNSGSAAGTGTTSGNTTNNNGSAAAVTNTTINSGGLTVALSASLVIQPKINVEVVRKTMFCLSACEAMVPCDGSIEQYLANLEEEEICDKGYPPCGCGSRSSYTTSNESQNAGSRTNNYADGTGYGL